MSPALLSGALVACLAAGLVDLTVLNLSVVPALVASAPSPSAARAAVTRRAQPHVITSAPLARIPAPQLDEPREPPRLLAVVEFEMSSYQLGARARWTLKLSRSAVRDASEIRVVGHADASGPDEQNERLSAERAGAVVQKLIDVGIAPERIQSDARGEREPRPEGNSRRVEIYVRGTP